MVDLVILSAGTEVVSLAVAEAAQKASIPYGIISLVPDSIIRDAPGARFFCDISRHILNPDVLHSEFIGALQEIATLSGRKFALMPSEDAGLRMLNEWRDDVLEFGNFSRARSLRMGGVDKAEVVERLNKAVPMGDKTARVICSLSEAKDAIEDFGEDVIFKPALKPLNMDLTPLGNGGVKVLTQINQSETRQSLLDRLAKAWPVSQRWIAQPRWMVGPNQERSVCAVRGQQIFACQVVERAKHPRMGGTAVWVAIDDRTDLIDPASEVLNALDVIGIGEVTYLPDRYGNAQLVEFNPRPWLQIGLVEHSGFDIVQRSTQILCARCQEETFLQDIEAYQWLHPERAALALGSGQLSLKQLMSIGKSALSGKLILGGYSTGFPKVRARLFSNSIKKLLGKR